MMGMPTLERWISQYPQTTILKFSKPVRSVAEAIEVSGFPRKEFIKTIVMRHKSEEILIACIITAGARVDKKSLRDGIVAKRWRLATPSEVMDSLGFPIGGVPPVCISQAVETYVDPRVLKREFVIGGGGTETSLLRLPAKLILDDGAKEKVVSFG